MTSSGKYVVTRRAPLHAQLAYRLRIVRVLSRTEFKLKYAGSVLGYFWSLAKPLLYFSVLWLVFGRIFRPDIPHFSLYLLIGIVLYTFLADAVALTLPAIVTRGTVLRRIAFPSLVIPLAIAVSTAMTLLLNLLAVAVFIAASGIVPHPTWLLLAPLLLEFFVFVVGISLIFSSLYVRFRDVAQIWEVLAAVLLFTSAIMYPISVLPVWFQKTVSFDPLVQVIQDARRIIIGSEPSVARVLTTRESRVWPILITLGILGLGLWLHRREAPRFPEVA